MPLLAGSDRATISHNISEMVRAGHPQRQAVAASLHNADKYRRADGGPVDDEPPDLSTKYNTTLSPQEEDAYQTWGRQQAAQRNGRNPAQDVYDYDMRGFWKSGGQFAGNGHAGDQFKKPNHPTFSTDSQYHGVDGNQGGTWGGGQDGKPSTFTPSQTNLNNYHPDRLRQYFQDRERGNILMMPEPQARALGGMMGAMVPNANAGIGSQSTGMRPAGMHAHNGVSSSLGLASKAAPIMPKRDGGGQIGGMQTLQPSAENPSGSAQNYIQRFAQMQPEQLQELIARMGSGSPVAAVATRVLQQKMLRPDAPKPVQTAQPTPLNPDQQQAKGQDPSQSGGMQPVQEAARGGKAKKDHDNVPILAAGGEFIVHPEHVARWGNGDLEKGHRALDKLVLAIRARTIKEMSKLAPPVGSDAAKKSEKRT